MPKPAHTPGPWHLEWPDEDEQRSNYHDDPTTCDPTAHVSTRRWGNFARVVVLMQGEPDAEGKANARLIAAAPDLLAALKGVLRVADRQTDEFDAARAAVARAEGGVQ